ncbi:MAG: Crp/Fnr family transcriptional regulator [Candidatus Methylacidiphilales bacterium]|nr:cyclic nucleotide-binding domain-containing protein [Candidatus Methylacidiphilales bacterium]
MSNEKISSIAISPWMGKMTLFAGLSPEALADIEDQVEHRRYKGGEVILSEGTFGEEVFIIAQGSVEVQVKNLDGRTSTLATLQPYDCFGEMCIIERQARCATIRTAEVSTIYVVKRSTLDQLRHTRPEQHALIIMNIARELAKRLRAMDERFVYGSVLCGAWDH